MQVLPPDRIGDISKQNPWRLTRSNRRQAKSLPPRCLLQERPLLEFLERLPQLLLGVHHDGAVPRHGLPERLSGAQEEPYSVLPGLYGELVAAVEQYQPAVFHHGPQTVQNPRRLTPTAEMVYEWCTVEFGYVLAETRRFRTD